MNAPARIHILSDDVINKIAAGEVVERPASVVKELVENALDAGSTQIDISVTDGGRKAIVVRDNGCGMTPDDALLALERHATSKITGVDDISRIATFGFRGEALAAIAAVSRLTLRTCAAGASVGVEISAVGGRIQDVRETGGPPGTAVTVRDLFFNTPARRKFLRSDATELAHIRQVFLLYALAYPEVGFTLSVDERETGRAIAGASPEERLRELFPNLEPALFRSVEGELGSVRLHGWVSLPALSRGDRSEHYLFVNRRPVVAAQILSALNEVYQTLLPRGRFPVVFLFVEVPPEEVDVNVHPTKKEVRFRHGNQVREAVLAAVRTALSAGGSTGASFAPIGSSGAPALSPSAVSAAPPAGGEPAALAAPSPIIAYPHRSLSPFPMTLGTEAPAVSSPAAHPADAELGEPYTRSPWTWCRILGQIHGLYVVLETEDGLVLMDPHAAHERVLYERFLADARKGRIPSQGLLTPETIHLPPAIAERVRNNLETLESMGFGISEFGLDVFLVDAVPAAFQGASVRDLLLEAARLAEEHGAQGARDRWSLEHVARAACRAAVKAHDRLTPEEIERLVLDLAATEMPYTCPHGRPTLLRLSRSELNRKFGRV